MFAVCSWSTYALWWIPDVRTYLSERNWGNVFVIVVELLQPQQSILFVNLLLPNDHNKMLCCCYIDKLSMKQKQQELWIQKYLMNLENTLLKHTNTHSHTLVNMTSVHWIWETSHLALLCKRWRLSSPDGWKIEVEWREDILGLRAKFLPLIHTCPKWLAI